MLSKNKNRLFDKTVCDIRPNTNHKNVSLTKIEAELLNIKIRCIESRLEMQ